MWLPDATVVGSESPSEAGAADLLPLDTRRRPHRQSATHWYLLSTVTRPLSASDFID